MTAEVRPAAAVAVVVVAAVAAREPERAPVDYPRSSEVWTIRPLRRNR